MLWMILAIINTFFCFLMLFRYLPKEIKTRQYDKLPFTMFVAFINFVGAVGALSMYLHP